METNFEQLIIQLTLALRQKLPGETAHNKMISEYRRNSPNEWNFDKIKESAVLALIYPNDEGKICILFTLRQSDIGAHSGQISLPGGRYEENDGSLKQTALRESFEEVGIIPETITIIGQLSEVLIPRSGFRVLPFVGFTERRPIFKIQPEEVAELFEIPLNELFKVQNKSSFQIEDKQGRKYHTPSYLVDGHHLWGATAMMMAELEEVIST
ncbi:MAG: CoA pyrophosphatase [Bacteroidales bacterium]|nr:CoA pyrophosphatase [Bacteroidales bacterium]